MSRSIMCVLIIFIVTSLTLMNDPLSYNIPEPSVQSACDNQMLYANTYTSHNQIVISTDTDFSTQGWPGNGTHENPYVIEGLNITAEETCISIVDTTVYFEIRNCLISSQTPSSSDGIYLNNVVNVKIQDCIIERHQNGISLIRADNCNLTDNIAINNANNGFKIIVSDKCILSNNLASNNINKGISLWESNYCRVLNNTVMNNSISGFTLYESHNNTLTSNTATVCGTGFSFSNSDNCTLTYNSAVGNSGYGIYLDTWSDNNTLYLNRFGDNGKNNARDHGGSNAWDDGISSGNYWKDYDGFGTYQILGRAGSVDYYPFVWESTATIFILITLVLIGTGAAVVLILISSIMRKRKNRAEFFHAFSEASKII